MKHNRNIFIIIGVTALACGQLQGLTSEESAKLTEFRRKLDLRYEQDIPEREQGIWLGKNTVIIEQMRLLDPSTAATYQEKQDQFVKKIAEHKKDQIRKKMELVQKQIGNEQAKIPNNYQEVDFSEISNSIAQIKQAIADVKELLTPTVLDSLNKKQLALSKLLAHAIFTNLIELAKPIEQGIATINRYIDQLLIAKDIFSAGFKRSSIKKLINSQINTRLTSASQRGLLSSVSEDIMIENTRNKAREAAHKIIFQVDNLLCFKFPEYINKLNTLSKKGKANQKNPILKKKNFLVTAQAIKVLDVIIENLYIKLSGIFRNGSPLVTNFDQQINSCRDTLSGLKTDLYNIYEVRGRKEDDKIKIRLVISILDIRFFYSDFFDDPLATISPSANEIEKDRSDQEGLVIARELKEEKQAKKLEFLRKINPAELGRNVLKQVKKLGRDIRPEELGSYILRQVKELASRMLRQLRRIPFGDPLKKEWDI